MFNLTLRELNKKADEMTFQRDTLEKVFRLADILQFMNTTEPLKNHLALKGGTAIHLTVFQLLRLSVDIDLDYHAEVSKAEMTGNRKLMTDIINRYMSSQGYHLSEKSLYTHSLDSFVFQYRNLIGNPDTITIEINYSNRSHLIDPIQTAIISPALKPSTILCLAKIDLFGSKMAALIDRTTPRDVYDVHKMITENVFRQEDFVELKKAAIFYLSLGIDNLNISDVLARASSHISLLTYRDIKRALIPVLKRSEVFDFKAAALIVNDFLAHLFELTENEKRYIALFNQGAYEPQLLFSEEAVIARIIHHPMALWKVQQRSMR